MTRAIKITVEGTQEEVEVNSLKDLQEAVGGLIEAVRLKDGATMYVNEEYLLNGSPANYFAADVAGLGGRPDLMLWPVRGDVIILGPPDADGEDTDILATTRRLIERVAIERV